MKISTKRVGVCGPVDLEVQALGHGVAGGMPSSSSSSSMPKSIAESGPRDQYGNTAGYYYKHDTTHAGYRDLPPEMRGEVRHQGANRRDDKNAWTAFGSGSPRPDGWVSRSGR
jgi:hypothetical protein